MAYFNNDPQERQEEYQPVFQQPVEDDYAAGDTLDDYPGGYDMDGEYYDDYLSEEELLEERKIKWKMIAGVGDFIGVLAGTVVILLLVALLINLITWVQADISQSFTIWQTKI